MNLHAHIYIDVKNYDIIDNCLIAYCFVTFFIDLYTHTCNKCLPLL